MPESSRITPMSLHLQTSAEDLLVAALTMASCYVESGAPRTAGLTALYLRKLADQDGAVISERLCDACENAAMYWSRQSAANTF